MTKVGIPRSLFYYYYGPLWQDFFDGLKIPYVVSPNTNQEIVNNGLALANDEMCLSLKNYLGHIDYLKDKCDLILIPRISNFKKSSQTCSNFWAIYDIVKNLFPIKLLHYNIDLDKKDTLKKGLYKIGKDILKYLNKNNVELIYSDKFNPQITASLSKKISKDLYFKYSKENLGSIVYSAKNINGIIFISSFPCAPDSIANELAMRKIDIPYLNLVIDDSSSFTGNT